MTIFLLIIFTSILGLVLWLWLNNNQNSQITQTVFSTFIVGGVATCFLIWNLLREKKINQSFATSIIVSKEFPNKQIQEFEKNNGEKKYTLPYSQMSISSGIILQEYKKYFPGKFKNTESTTLSGEFYSEIIGYHILELLFRTFSHSWSLEIKEYKTPQANVTLQPNNLSEKNQKISWERLTKNINRDIFKIASLNTPNGFRDTLILPPTSKIELTVNNDELFTFIIENRYSSIKIKLTRLIEGGFGLGEIQSIAHFTPEESYKFNTYSYSFEIEGKIKKLYSGSKYAEKCETWINSIISLLKNEFDYQIYSDRLKEWRLYGQ